MDQSPALGLALVALLVALLGPRPPPRRRDGGAAVRVTMGVVFGHGHGTDLPFLMMFMCLDIVLYDLYAILYMI